MFWSKPRWQTTLLYYAVYYLQKNIWTLFLSFRQISNKTLVWCLAESFAGSHFASEYFLILWQFYHPVHSQFTSGSTKIVGGDRGVRISRFPYPNILPLVPFCPASPTSFTGNILYYNRACQVKESSSKVAFCQDICVFWRYMQIKQYDNVKITIYYILFQRFINVHSNSSCHLCTYIHTYIHTSFFRCSLQGFSATCSCRLSEFESIINVVSRCLPPEDSRLPLFPLPPPVSFLPGSRPLSPPWFFSRKLVWCLPQIWGALEFIWENAYYPLLIYLF